MSSVCEGSDACRITPWHNPESHSGYRGDGKRKGLRVRDRTGDHASHRKSWSFGRVGSFVAIESSRPAAWQLLGPIGMVRPPWKQTFLIHNGRYAHVILSLSPHPIGIRLSIVTRSGGWRSGHTPDGTARTHSTLCTCAMWSDTKRTRQNPYQNPLASPCCVVRGPCLSTITQRSSLNLGADEPLRGTVVFHVQCAWVALAISRMPNP